MERSKFRAVASSLGGDGLTFRSLSFLYILQANATEIGVMRLNGAGHALNVGNFNLARPARAAGLKIGESLFFFCTSELA